jgi:hypothetical protein
MSLPKQLFKRIFLVCVGDSGYPLLELVVWGVASLFLYVNIFGEALFSYSCLHLLLFPFSCFVGAYALKAEKGSLGIYAVLIAYLHLLGYAILWAQNGNFIGLVCLPHACYRIYYWVKVQKEFLRF